MSNIFLPTAAVRVALPSLPHRVGVGWLLLAASGGGGRLTDLSPLLKEHGVRPRHLDALAKKDLAIFTLSPDLQVSVALRLTSVPKRRTPEYRRHYQSVHGEPLYPYPKGIWVSRSTLLALAALPHSAGALWLFLRSNAQEVSEKEFVTHPFSYTRLAERLGWRWHRVQNALNALSEAGLIQYEEADEKRARYGYFCLRVRIPHASTPPALRPLAGWYTTHRPKRERLHLAKQVAHTLEAVQEAAPDVRNQVGWLGFVYTDPRTMERHSPNVALDVPRFTRAIALGKARPKTRVLDPNDFLNGTGALVPVTSVPGVRITSSEAYRVYLATCAVHRWFPVPPGVFQRAFARWARAHGAHRSHGFWWGITTLEEAQRILHPETARLNVLMARPDLLRRLQAGEDAEVLLNEAETTPLVPDATPPDVVFADAVHPDAVLSDSDGEGWGWPDGVEEAETTPPTGPPSPGPPSIWSVLGLPS